MWWNNNFIILAILVSLEISRSQTRDAGNHECLRFCTDEALSKKLCRYEFYVGELSSTISSHNRSKIKDESRIPSKSFLGINGKSPGPQIEICLGDTIEVLLYNRLGSEELSLHWHGLRQNGSAHMDGVPMVTQCSILPFGGFRYKIKPERIGSYIYYAHSVSQQADGVYGSLTVRGPQDDPSLERILLLSSRPPTPLSWHSHLHPPTPGVLLLNGQTDGTILRVNHGAQYLLRLVNANAYNCPVRISISRHDFRVSAADGNVVDSVTGRHIVSYPGERLDVIVETNQPSGKYLIDIKGLEECQNLRQEAFILYNDVQPDSAIIKDEELSKINDHAIANKGYDCHEISKNFICALDLKGSKETSNEIYADQVIYIPFDVNVFPFFTDELSDNRYNVYGCAFYPSYLSMNKNGIKIMQINGITFKYPTSPLLSQPENIQEESICSLEKPSKQCAYTPLFCECTQIIEVPARKYIDIILIDEGFGGNVSHTFHIHGYNASILGRGTFERPISKDEVVFLDRNRQLHRNIVNPPQKDSFVVPNKGYVILRLFTNNLGYWLWEARSTAISPKMSGPGMQFLLKVGNRESFVPIPLDFPTCGNNKPPDLVFEIN
ncbi:laccase-14-like isoform X1 [Osmia bicornis bicornis]|uniref:laccase-14-like isoform X1 n=1 Tax=Osmia bicornis bicornis TaxID=1437191 RepID=UPI001EAEB6C8|nr:laccase-14-like isoform X1 [Osmia bicornis bicornis]XP_046144232.1 laccase-14-like isoform X1 [Osmia bicornis bicornis]